MTEWLIGPGIGILAGLLAGLFGVGGAGVLIPLLGAGLRLSQREAQGVSLAVMLLPLGLPALWTYRRRGVRIPWGLAAWIILGFLPGVWLGAHGAQRIHEGLLLAGFGIFLVFTAVRLWRVAPSPGAGEPAPRPHRALGPWIGLLAGLASGLLGIGGGMIIIPLLMGWAGLDQLEAQGTSLAVLLLPIGLPGVWVYAQSGSGLPWFLLGGVAAGFAVGALFGARLATRIPQRGLRRAFAVFLVGMLGLMLLRRG